MNRPSLRPLAAGLALGLSVVFAGPAAAYPDKPVRYIIPFPAGGVLVWQHSQFGVKAPDLRKKMVEGGFEVVDIGDDKMPAFLRSAPRAPRSSWA